MSPGFRSDIAEAAIATHPSNVAFTPAVKAAQKRNGSRRGYARTDRSRGWETSATAELAEFLAKLDMFYLATATGDGHPHVQYHGGPPSFLKVLNDHTLAFAERPRSSG